jgi:DNA-binding NarL/FixJ family response regulator
MVAGHTAGLGEGPKLSRTAALSTGDVHRSAVIVDRYPLWLDALERLLSASRVRVVATATEVAHGPELVEEHRPDLLVLGIDESDATGDLWDSLRKLHARFADLRTVVVSSDVDEVALEHAFAAGAAAYCVKWAAAEDFAVAIRQSFQNSIFLAGSRTLPATSELPLGAERPNLTRREHEILKLVAEGHSNTELARMLWVTEQTVKFHLSNVYRKLNVANRTEASRWAQLNGLLPANPAAQEPSAA